MLVRRGCGRRRGEPGSYSDRAALTFIFISKDSVRSNKLSYPRLAWGGQFIRFAIVGAAGFIANVSAVYLARGLLGLYAVGMVGWLFAATLTWVLNRVWTFKGRGSGVPPHRQWALFLAVNLVGFVLYYGTYVVLVANSSFVAAQPITAVFAGMLAGVAANFVLSRSFVFC